MISLQSCLHFYRKFHSTLCLIFVGWMQIIFFSALSLSLLSFQVNFLLLFLERRKVLTKLWARSTRTLLAIFQRKLCFISWILILDANTQIASSPKHDFVIYINEQSYVARLFSKQNIVHRPVLWMNPMLNELLWNFELW